MENRRYNLRLCKVSFEEILIYISEINCLDQEIYKSQNGNKKSVV